MSQGYVLYGRQGGGSLAPQMLLEELGVPYEIIWIEKGVNEAYLKICPTGKIPALVLPDDTSIFESAAICIHLATVHQDAQLAPVPGTVAHAQFLQWMLFLATSVYGSVLRMYYAGRYTTSDDANGVNQAALKEFEGHLALLESQLSGAQLGSAVSVADLYLTMLAGWHPDEYEGISEKFPKLGALCQKILARPAVARVIAQNQ